MLNPTPILTDTQKKILELLSNSQLVDTFYLSGGTALCGFYIPYRYSEDLDFFSEQEFEITDVSSFVKTTQESLKFLKFDMQTSFNRNLFFLEFPKETVKLEFTYFPFPQQDTPQLFANLRIDTLRDIALNKVFTIYQKPRLRDFMDLYQILQHSQTYSFQELIADARIKFDWHIDRIQLGSQLMKVQSHEDTPRLIDDFNYKEMEQTFLAIAKQLGEDILQQ